MTAPARASSCNRQRALLSLVSLFITLSLIGTSILSAGAQPLAVPAEPQRASLVVLIVTDQFPYNFLYRYKDKFQAGGLRLLLDQGAHYANCQYKFATTHASCGAAAISTGSAPWHTGVVGNTWYDRRKRGPITATTDESVQLVGANGVAGSNKAVQGSTIGDQMKLATNGRSKVFAISVDQSPGLLLGGRLANNAFWFDPKTGNMVSSSKYGGTLAGWVKAFNDMHYADKSLGKPWQRLLPETQYAASTRDDYPYERTMPGDGKVFPHVVNTGSPSKGQDLYEHFAMTPMANEMIVEFAKEAVDKEFLGQHTDPDLLVVGLSAGEKLTQYFGPYSQETEDLVLRMDQSLVSLLQLINQKVGLNKSLIIFTASHGSPAIPEFSKERGLDAGRIDPKAFTNFIDAKLDSKIAHEDWIEAFDPPNLYLNLDAIDRQKLRQPEVEQVVAQYAHGVPGIGDVFTAWQLYTNQLPNSPLIDKVRRSYYFARSGEVYITPKPGYVWLAESTGTGYGSPYTYDTQVPLLLYGAGVKPGRYLTNVSPIDIAPTIAAYLGFQAPSGSEGTPLDEAFFQQIARTAAKQEVKPIVEEEPKDKRKPRK